MTTDMTPLKLAFGLEFSELYTRDGLVALDAEFVEYVKNTDTGCFNRLMTARLAPDNLSQKEESEFLLLLAPQVEAFVAILFGIEQEMETLRAKHLNLNPLYAAKRLFVQRRAAKAYSAEAALALNSARLDKDMESLLGTAWDELAFATLAMRLLEASEENAEALQVMQAYAAWALYTTEGQARHAKGILFKLSKKMEADHLIAVETEVIDGVTRLKLPDSHARLREGFNLTDPRGSLQRALDEANYCIYCAHQGRDSCSRGMREKTGEFKKNTLGITLNGCPLEEKISEMNELKAGGYALAALAMVTVDNPMCAGTGHRICNDCMKSCIYQKQQPVDIPLTETRVLDDVLSLPFGFEIYSLLTRWNPLNLRRPLPKPPTGYKVLVVGLGPAGYTLSHHLMNDGHMVVAIDGLKIEPLDPALSGVDVFGERAEFQPIKNIESLRQPLGSRAAGGFGGVAEYGITVRWDKNYLTMLRLLLERRAQFSMMGGVRFGSQLTRESAFALGFDHIALCMGAGKPTLLGIENGLARGVRTASDFLMSLQLTGAARAESIANLQLRLPVVVIGGGLTAIDTATEALAYYPIQVEKFLTRYEHLGENARIAWTAEETEIAEEFILHAHALRAERKLAEAENRPPRIASLLKSWGGACVAYRKRLVDAPSYRLNHEEVEKALEEGIMFIENVTPVKVDLDDYGHVKSLAVSRQSSDQIDTFDLQAKAILIAAGTSPNTVLAREDGQFLLDGYWFAAVDAEGNMVSPERVAKPAIPQVLMRNEEDGRAVSFFGDLHPSFAGNVVKAMGSAKQGYPAVSRILLRIPKDRNQIPNPESFSSYLNSLLRARVHAVNRLAPNIIEVVIQAPLAAKAFEPGQFYRLQNFEVFAAKTKDTTLAMEGLAMTGAWVDKDSGLLAVIALEMGGSSNLCAHLKAGEPVVLMGPTGAATEIPKNETVLLAGGGLGNAVLFSIGKAMRANGCKVLYFAGYRQPADRYKIEEIEAAADVIVWTCDEGDAFVPSPNRSQDKHFHGNIVQAMLAYAEGSLGEQTIRMANIEHIIAIGSSGMMAAVAHARHNILKPYLKPGHKAIGSINSPMQCMMKEICAQCLAEHRDPETGALSYVYSCFNQDQCLDMVHFPHLNERLKQNSLSEKVTRHWISLLVKAN